MTVFEKIKSMDIDEFAKWFEENCSHDTDPCIKWWDKKYCQNCEAVIKDDMKYGYCELYGKCKYFKDIDNVLDWKETIKLWLESENEE